MDVHHDPANASGAGLSALNFDQFAELIVQIRDVAKAVGRSLTDGWGDQQASLIVILRHIP